MTESLTTLKVNHGTVRPNYLLNGQSLDSFVLFAELRNVTCATHQEGEENLVTSIVSEYSTSKDFIFTNGSVFGTRFIA